MTGLTAEKHDSFLSPTGDGTAIAEFSGKELVQGEPDASLVPLRRHPRHLRGPRLHRLGPDQPRLHPRRPQRRHARHPDRVPVSWTGEALDKKTPLLRSMEALSNQALRILRLFGNTRGQEGLHHRRPRAGILPDRQELLLRPARPAQRRPHPVRRQAAQGPGAGRPVLRHHPRARAGLHGRLPRPSCSSSACRSRPGTTRSPRASTRSRRSSRTRNLATDHQMLTMEVMRRTADEVRPGLPAAREAVRRHQRLGQAQQLVDVHRHRREPAQPRRHAARQRPVPRLLRGRHPGRGQVPGTAARVGRRRRPTTTASAPTRRRRPSSRSSWATSCRT